MLSVHDSLIYIMVMVSAADQEMTDAELRTIGEMIEYLPIFKDFSSESLTSIASGCADLLANDDGLERGLDMIKESLPPILRETAYALSCDIAAADGVVSEEEIRLLEMIRHRLDIERLVAAAIERGARARHITLENI